MVALQQVEEPMRQAVLDEWDARCKGTSIRNPAGYLFGIVQRAIRGEFNAWAGQVKPAPPPASLQPAEPRNVVPPELARKHIERLRDLLKKS